ncbi:MAG: hypothetical protein U0520_04835 [Candidatus Saccharimonadales bacterium]
MAFAPTVLAAPPAETILTENQFHGGGVGQGWNSDDDVWEYTLPFSFTFFDQEYTTTKILY